MGDIKQDTGSLDYSSCCPTYNLALTSHKPPSRVDGCRGR